MNVVKQEMGNGTPIGERAAAPRREERLQVVAPPVDVHEAEEGFLVAVDLPGVAPEDLSIHLEKGELVVRGTRSEVGLEYRRVLAVPPDVDGEAIQASFGRGVLDLKLPRKSSARPRQIPIQSS